MRPKQLLRLAIQSARSWFDDFAPSMGAAISYYTVFSLAPLLVIVIAIAGAVFGREAVQGQIVAQLGGLIGKDGAVMVAGPGGRRQRHRARAGRRPGISIVGADGRRHHRVRRAAERAGPHLARAGVAEAERHLAMLRTRLLSFGLILGLAFLLMVSLIVSAGLAAFGAWRAA